MGRAFRGAYSKCYARFPGGGRVAGADMVAAANVVLADGNSRAFHFTLEHGTGLPLGADN
jgi:hypothetical protein